MPNEKWTSAGGVALDSLQQPYKVFICKPSNNYGPWSFPKGRVDKGEDLETTALREVEEEAGVPSRLLDDGYLGTGVGSYSITHYYMMVRTGPVGSHDFEMEEVRCVTLDEAEQILSGAGNNRDVQILTRAREFLDKMKPVSESYEPVNELKMNLLGKIFFGALGACILGKLTNIKLRGSQNEIKAISNALLTSKRLHEELMKPGATVQSVAEKLNAKHMSAQEFERELGLPWPL